jgi:hypothetical protein
MLNRVIELEHKLGNVPQVQPLTQLMPEPAGGGFDTLHKILFGLQAQYAEIDLAVLQIAGRLCAGDANHPLLNAGILYTAKQTGKTQPDVLICPL